MTRGSNWNPITTPAFAVSDGNVPHVIRFDEGWVSESLGALTSSLVDPEPVVRHRGEWWYEEGLARIAAREASKARLSLLQAEMEQHEAILAGRIRVLSLGTRRRPKPASPGILTEAQARKVWEIVARTAGEPDLDPEHTGGREAFVRAATDPEHPTNEFRFKGRLGSGGKIYIKDDREYGLGCHVAYYVEDRTPERDAMCLAANTELTALAKSSEWIVGR